jgi:hypothetical protein
VSILKRKKPSMSSEKPSDLAMAYSIRKSASKRMAHGGMVESPEPAPKSISEAIRRKKMEIQSKDKGEVDLEANNAKEQDADYFDELNEDAAGDLYDLDQLSDQPEDSNMKGDDLDGDDLDMISAIRKRMKAKRGE